MWLSSKALAFAVALISLAGCRNLYSDFSANTSTDYLLYEAEKDIDALRFTRAIRNLDVVLGRVPAHEHANYMYSIAHSGRAGLRVISIFETLSGSGGTSLFGVLADSLTTMDDDDLLDFKVAVDSLELIGPTADVRTAEQNFYALFLYLGRIGAVINRYAYDDTNALLSASFSSCHTISDKAAVKTGIPNDDIDVVMTMIPRIIDTVDQLSQQGSGALLDVSDLQAIGTFDYDPIPCSLDPNDVSCLAVRTIINNNSTGLGLGTGSGPEAIACLGVTP